MLRQGGTALLNILSKIIIAGIKSGLFFKLFKGCVL